MWKSEEENSVNTNIFDFLKVISFFMGFRDQFCFQILTLEIKKNTFLSKKMRIMFWGKNSILTKNYIFENC